MIYEYKTYIVIRINTYLKMEELELDFEKKIDKYLINNENKYLFSKDLNIKKLFKMCLMN